MQAYLMGEELIVGEERALYVEKICWRGKRMAGKRSLFNPGGENVGDESHGDESHGEESPRIQYHILASPLLAVFL
jgi:hypothetical protein